MTRHAKCGAALHSMPSRARRSPSHAAQASLDEYEGSDTKFARNYLNPDQQQTDDRDVEYEHPADLERPEFHAMPARGFVSDPCGPLYDPRHKRYHLFFQNVPDSIEWKFGIIWGHVTSPDLVHWEHMPPALQPGIVSPDDDGYFRWDADGCFTGCATIAPDGKPTILYTGVRLRNNERAGPLPAPDDDTDMPFFEAQLCAAQASPADERLEKWAKLQDQALAESPPAELRPAKNHTGWRDPFLLEHPSNENGMMFTMLIGNGSSKKGGRVLVYRSKSLTSGWHFTGVLCDAEDDENGNLWEYPVLARLPEAGETEDGTIDFDSRPEDKNASASERDHVFLTGPDAPVNPCIYWVGSYDSSRQKFNLKNALGPFRLDIGEVLYAVNSFKDAHGRQILFGWLQEGERDDHGYSYAGCESVPRELLLRKGRIVQRPIPELQLLRGDNILDQEESLEVEPGRVLPLPADAGNNLDILVSLQRGSASQSGLIIGSWAAGGRGTCALLYDWQRNYLEAVFDTHFICPETKKIRSHVAHSKEGQVCPLIVHGYRDKPFGTPRKDLNRRTVGGPVEPPPQGNVLKLRVLLDGSVLEVFTHTGTALATRVYRGMQPKGACCDIGFMSLGGATSVSQVQVWNMKSCWKDAEKWAADGKQVCGWSQLVPASKLTKESKYGDEEVGRCKACKGLHREGECPVFKDGKHPGDGDCDS